MTKAHRDIVLELAPHRLNHTFTLSEAARLVSKFEARTVTDLAALRSHLARGDVSDISDPIGQDADVFAMVGSQIAELMHPIIHLCRNEF